MIKQANELLEDETETESKGADHGAATDTVTTVSQQPVAATPPPRWHKVTFIMGVAADTIAIVTVIVTGIQFLLS